MLPSGITATLGAPQVVHLSTRGGGGTVSAFAGGGVGQGQGGGGAGLTGTITDDTSPPSRRELARRFFTGLYSGTYTIGPPRLADQSRSFRIKGPGYNNQFHHATLDLIAFTPADPALQITGAASLIDRNTNSGGVILFNIIANSDQVDGRGRPIHFAFNINGGGGSGAIYASSVGTGTVDIRYHNGRADVKFLGSIFTSGVGNPLLDFTTNKH